MGFSRDTKAHLCVTIQQILKPKAVPVNRKCYSELRVLLSSRVTELKPFGLNCKVLYWTYWILIPTLYLFVCFFLYVLMSHIACSHKSVGVFLSSEEFCQLKILFTHMIIFFWVRIAVRNDSQTTLSGLSADAGLWLRMEASWEELCSL